MPYPEASDGRMMMKTAPVSGKKPFVRMGFGRRGYRRRAVEGLNIIELK
jgi:hypothetical protein